MQVAPHPRSQLANRLLELRAVTQNPAMTQHGASLDQSRIHLCGRYSRNLGDLHIRQTDALAKHNGLAQNKRQPAGFNDLSYFNRSFRKRFGDTPSAIQAEFSKAR
jgi:hypothetical protein